MYTKSGAGGAMPIATGQCGSGIFYIVDALDIQQQGYPVVITYPKDGVSYGIEANRYRQRRQEHGRCQEVCRLGYKQEIC